MTKLSTGLAIALLAASPALAETDLDWKVGLSYSRFSTNNLDIDTTRLSLGATYRFNDQVDLGFGLDHARSDAFGLDFSTTNVYVEPRFRLTDTWQLGAYLRYSTTDNPANLDPITGFGLTARYSDGPLHVGAYAGVIGGNQVNSPGDNTSIGLRADMYVSDNTALFVHYERDHWAFRNQEVGAMDFGVRYRSDRRGSMPPWETEFTIGRFVVNNLEYDKIGLTVSIPLGGSSTSDIMPVDLTPYSASLRVPYSF